MSHNLPKEEIAYAAGIVDGEGHIYRPLCRNGRGDKHYSSRIVVINSDKKLIDWLVERFGGYVYKPKKQLPHYKQLYRLTYAGKKAEALAKLFQPYLIAKREQVKCIL